MAEEVSLLPRRYIPSDAWTKDVIDELVCKIPEGGCWIWMGGMSGSGKPYIKIAGKAIPATYVVWRVYKGQPAKTNTLCHTCDNKCCVNPYHLYEGTHQTNARDAILRGQQKTKLSADDVRNIRILIEQKIPQVSIAARFKVSTRMIRLIVNRERWDFV